MVLSIKHHKDLIHRELLGGQCHPGAVIMWTPLEGDGLTPLVASGLNAAIRGDDDIASVGGGSDLWVNKENNKSLQLQIMEVETFDIKNSIYFSNLI